MTIAVTSREWHLIARPHGRPRPEDFALREARIPPLAPGQVLVRNLYLSVDPYMRRRMDDVESYVPPFRLGEPMEGGAVGVVVASAADGIAVGDHVQHMLGWREHAVLRPADATPVDPAVAPVSAYLGALGTTGLTAYAGLLRIAALQPGDVVFVSAAAGAVGNLAVQIAKLRGHIVIGSAGSAAKVRFLRETLGCDEAFCYREGDVRELLRAAAPDGIDVYFDNVGGEHLEAALDSLRMRGRIALCGAVSDYNRDLAVGPRNLFNAVAKGLTLRGFLARMYADQMDVFRREMRTWLAEGRIVYPETLLEGIEQAPRALIAQLAGENLGKVLVRLV